MKPLKFFGACILLVGLFTSVDGEGAETVTQWALRFLGISANPSSMKGPNDDARPGDLWITNLSEQIPTALTSDGGYQWPVFELNGKAIIAIRHGAIVRVPLNGESQRTLHRVGRVSKLIGFDRKDANKLLVLVGAQDGGSMPGELSLASGIVGELRDGQQNQKLMAHLQTQERIYAEAAVYPRTVSDTSVSGAQIEWTDTYYSIGGNDPINVSRCRPGNCDQPSLSPDGRRVVFVKSDR